MSFLSNTWDTILDAFKAALQALHDVLLFVGDEPAWGFAIILLTVLVRLVLLPLAVKQTRSMRAMQTLQPQIKEIQEKHKVDRSLLKKDPEKYKAKRQKMNEEMMALYREEGVNPASGCLPLVAQAPIFFALFSVLRDFDPIKNADFYFLTAYADGDATGLGAVAREAGWPGWLLIGLMIATMFLSQRQMMSTRSADGAQATQQKVMMYGMPVFLGFIAQSLPLGVLLYWVTTNVWQFGQQSVILHEVGEGSEEGGGSGNGRGPGGGGSPPADSGPSGNGSGAKGKKKPKKSDASKKNKGKTKRKSRPSKGHTPRRPSKS